MFSRILLTTLLAASALAQSSPATPAQSSAVAGATSAPSSSNSNLQDTGNLVQYLLPSAAPSSLNPTQASRIASDAAAYLAAYTASHPLASLEQNAGVAVILDSTQPSGAQQTSIQDLLGMAGTAALANPSAYVQSVEQIVQPFAFAGAVTSYANGLFDGLRTVVGSDLSVSVPAPTSASSKAAANGRVHAVPTGAVGIAAAAVVGAAGMMI